MFTLYCSLLNVKSLCPQNNVYTLIYKNISLQKILRTFKPSMSHNLFVDEGSCLLVDGCSWIRVVVVEGWRGCGRFLNQTAMKFSASMDSFFHERFLCSIRCCLILIAFYLQQNFFQYWSQSSQMLPPLYQLSLCNILSLCCHFNSVHSVFTRSTLHFKKPLYLLIHKK